MCQTTPEGVYVGEACRRDNTLRGLGTQAENVLETQDTEREH